MKTWKIVGIVVLSLVFLVTLMGSPCLAKITIKMASEGTDQPPPPGLKHNMPGIDVMKGFAKLIKERSNGEIEVELYFGTMGPAKKLFGSVMLGTLDIVAFSTGIMSYFKGGENFSILWAPYLFQTTQEFNGWMRSDMAKSLMDPIEKNMKMKILGPAYWRTNRWLSTKDQPVWSVEDMKGIKFRTPPSRIFTEAFTAWGSIPTPMAWTELFMALKQDVVQGQDNGLDVLVGYQFYTVQKYAMVTDHMMGGYMYGINFKRWNSFTPAQQKLINDVIEELYEWQKPLFKEALDEHTQYLASKGMRIIIPNLGGFKKAAHDMNMRLDKEGSIWEKGLYKKVEDWLIKNYRQ